VSALADYDGRPGGLSAVPTTCINSGADDTFTIFSNFGADVDIAAPGACINSTWPFRIYRVASGTSMSAPHVAGAAALHLAANPDASPAQVKAALLAAADPGPIAGDRDAFAEPVLNVSRF
jgi:subtilisin